MKSRIVELIDIKKKGGELHSDQWEFFIDGILTEQISESQAAALLMAIWFQGLNSTETSLLTSAMAKSGKIISFENIPGLVVDKHSSGGVGDKISIVLIPLLAATGLSVAKMSGTGLGHTGGTIDKLQSIKGLETEMNIKQFKEAIKEQGIAIASQASDMVPADRYLYDLRDRTGTVDSIPLIASSIMSKKLALKTDALLLDLKVGKGAFVRDTKFGLHLAELMLEIAASEQKNTAVVLTAMDQPLGNTIGNAVELQEAVYALDGESPADLLELTLCLGAVLLELTHMERDRETARKKLQGYIDSGKALEMLLKMLTYQARRKISKEDIYNLELSTHTAQLSARNVGYINEIDAGVCGEVAMKLGAGREFKGQQIDYGAGIKLHAKVGDRVEVGDPLATLYTEYSEKLPELKARLEAAYEVVHQRVEASPLILDELVYKR